MVTAELNRNIHLAAQWIREAEGILITAGAGMGVDSGLPDFRGDQGLWKHYPALGKRQMRFADIASPETFFSDPTLAWGFYGHRLQLYRKTAPHQGFSLLKQWANRCAHGAFVFTSNVDGQFQAAGFPESRVAECHGSIHYLQCCHSCDDRIWPAGTIQVDVDPIECRLRSELPRCPSCGGLARPNILMFGDFQWLEQRTATQLKRLDRWLNEVKQLVIIELGAGTTIPSVRRFGEGQNAPLIRINPRESAVHGSGRLGIPLNALEALLAIDKAMQEQP